MARKPAAVAVNDPVSERLVVNETPINDIKEYPNNPRQHSVEQIEMIAKSIREFGFTNPCLVDANNELIAGHGRLAACRKLGMTSVPTIRLGYLSPLQKRALVIADNKIAISGSQWDIPLLKLELAELKLEHVDLTLSGFSTQEIDQLFAPLIDPTKEWEGMPEFEQNDKMAFKTLAVHLKDQDAVDEFARIIDQKIGAKTRFVWFPLIEIKTHVDKRWATQ
jgi:ParB-like chromosome segregation protein Spo0J